jgi:hypothetical protein
MRQNKLTENISLFKQKNCVLLTHGRNDDTLYKTVCYQLKWYRDTECVDDF